jgi:hypothetical protein
MAAKLFTIANIADGEFGKQVKFQIKSNGTTLDEIGSKDWSHSETYYRWYTSLNDGVVVGKTVNLDPDKYDKVVEPYTIPETGKSVPLTYLKDKK